MGLGLFLNIGAIYEIKELQAQLIKKNRELRDLARVATILADGIVKMEEAPDIPSEHTDFIFAAQQDIANRASYTAEYVVAEADAMRAQMQAAGQPYIPYQQVTYERAKEKAMAEHAKLYLDFIKNKEQSVAAEVESLKQQIQEQEKLKEMGENMQKKSNDSIRYVA